VKTARDFVRKLELLLCACQRTISFRAVALIEKHAPGDGRQLGDARLPPPASNTQILITGHIVTFAHPRPQAQGIRHGRGPYA